MRLNEFSPEQSSVSVIIEPSVPLLLPRPIRQGGRCFFARSAMTKAYEREHQP
jgi:hypothetical protein